MRAIYLIARREFLSYVATWGFWLSLASVPMFMALGFGLPILIESSQPTRHYVLIDETGGTLDEAVTAGFQRDRLNDIAEAQEAIASVVGDSPQLQAAIEAGAQDTSETQGRYVRVDPGPRDLDGLLPYLRGEQLLVIDGEAHELFAAIFLDRNAEGRVTMDYWSKIRTDSGLMDRVRRALEGFMREEHLIAEGVSPAIVAAADALTPELRELTPQRADGAAAVTSADRLPIFVGIAVAFGLWIIIFSVVNMLLTAMIEEKGNKVLEMMLSTSRHHEILTGKLLGVAAVSATLLLFWGLLALGGGLAIQQAAAALDMPVAVVIGAVLDPGLLLPALGYFVVGYLMYGAIFLAVGSLCETIQDAQTLMSPIMLMMMVPLFLVMIAANSPDSPIITFASWVPMWTPFIMLARLPQDPPMIEVLGSTGLMIATAILVIWGAGVVFRMGALNQANQETVKNWFRLGGRKSA